jgi:hypothetical protein
MADTDKKTTAAYVSWGTFKNAIEQLSQALPNRIDRTVFIGMSWALQNQLFSSLRFMGLTDQDNRPTKDLAELVASDENHRKTKLREILQRQYADLFALDLKKTTPGELSQKMGESYAAVGETREKAVRFFTSAAEYVGIELSPLFDSAKKTNGAPAVKRGRRPKTTRQSPPLDLPPAAPRQVGTSKTVRLQSGGDLVLSATLGIFSLNPKDRKFIVELIERLEEYENALPPTEPAAASEPLA